jgi:hypothetical protein
MNQEFLRMQRLAGLITEAEAVDPIEQNVEKELEDFLGDLKSASIKPSPKDGEIQEGILTIGALVAGAPGLLNLLGKGADLVGKYFSQGTITSTKVGSVLQKAGRKLEHKYIEGIAALLKKAYPKKYTNQDPFDEKSELYDSAHGIYAAILAAAAVSSGVEASSAVNTIVKALEGGAAVFKTAEVAQLAKSIVAA